MPNAEDIFPDAYLRVWDLAKRTGGLYNFAGAGLPWEAVKDVHENGASFIAQGVIRMAFCSLDID